MQRAIILGVGALAVIGVGIALAHNSHTPITGKQPPGNLDAAGQGKDTLPGSGSLPTPEAIQTRINALINDPAYRAQLLAENYSTPLQVEQRIFNDAVALLGGETRDTYLMYEYNGISGLWQLTGIETPFQTNGSTSRFQKGLVNRTEFNF